MGSKTDEERKRMRETETKERHFLKNKWLGYIIRREKNNYSLK